MDTSEQYIKMCDYPEIQGQKPKGNEFTISSKNPDIWIEHEGNFLYAKHDVWLPRQDQIQEMMGTDNKEPFCTWLERLGKFTHLAQPWDIPIDKNGLKTIGWLETWEQLWLAFYIYEKHNKIWNGEKWREK